MTPAPSIWFGADDPTSGALRGIRIVDLSRVLAGPYCSQILGDHGANVIKVEPPQGDETRNWGPPYAGDTSAYFSGLNRNKRGIVLDLKQPAAREALAVLLDEADVLLENFKPGTLEAWGLSVDDLAARFPRLVHCRVSGFGADGPLGGRPGYDAAIQAVTGLMSINGELNGPPTRIGVPIVDMVTGLNAVVGILLALQSRARSGLGQFVDVSLYDCAVSVLHPHAANTLSTGQAPVRSGNAHPNIVPYDLFRTRCGDLFLAVGNDSQFTKLCSRLGHPELAADSRFARNSDRSTNRLELRQALEELLADQEAGPFAETLMQDGVPCGAVHDVQQALTHPHTVHRGLVLEEGDYRGIASPIKLSRDPPALRRPPPAFGQHNLEILGQT